MNRRYFFRQLASGLVAAAAPSLFLPKLIKPGWKARPKFQYCWIFEPRHRASIAREHSNRNVE